jgi:CRP-like cAMP-binding protein
MRKTAGNRQYADHLKAIPEFAACSRKQLEAVGRLADNLTVQPGELLTREGRIDREFFVIVSGEATVTRGGEWVADLGPGDFFGELAAIDPGPRNATVTASSVLEVLIIGPREFGAMAEIPGFRDALLRGMTRRLRSADETRAHPAPAGPAPRA